jgi:hypothetical protein
VVDHSRDAGGLRRHQPLVDERAGVLALEQRRLGGSQLGPKVSI